MEDNKKIELRSEKVLKIIGQVPPGLLRYGTTVIGLALCMLVAAAAFIPYQPKKPIGIVAAQDEKGKIHYTARIPQRAMAQRADFMFITSHLPVEGPMPVHFIFHDVQDTLHVSNSGGWYEVEIYPIDTDTQAIKISTPINFPAKIEFNRTTLMKRITKRR